MIIGNQDKIATIKQYIANNAESQKPLFLLILGAEGIGKSDFLYQYSQELLGDYFQSDFLWLKDLSEILGKTHIIPVEKSKSTPIIEEKDGQIYQNKGIREVNDWLQQSGFSGKKILLIENMQRMNKSSMNAFLKTAEEPLQNRIIFATANNSKDLVDTLVSRAFIIHFNLLSDAEIQDYIAQNRLDFGSTALQESITEIAGGRVKTLLKLKTIMEENPDLSEDLIWLRKHLKEQGSSNKKITILKKFEEARFLTLFIDAQIEILAKQGDIDAEKWIKVKKMLNSNVSLENALRYAVL